MGRYQEDFNRTCVTETQFHTPKLYIGYKNMKKIGHILVDSKKEIFYVL
jgi:hypothetical protein